MKDFFKLKIADTLSRCNWITVERVTFRGQGWSKVGVGAEVHAGLHRFTLEPTQYTNKDYSWFVVYDTVGTHWSEHVTAKRMSELLSKYCIN